VTVALRAELDVAPRDIQMVGDNRVSDIEGGAAVWHPCAARRARQRHHAPNRISSLRDVVGLLAARTSGPPRCCDGVPQFLP